MIDVLENQPQYFESSECGYRHYDYILFRNGYKKYSHSILVECKGITCDFGINEWGAIEGKRFFVIKLGKIISNTKNNNMLYNRKGFLLPDNSFSMSEVEKFITK